MAGNSQRKGAMRNPGSKKGATVGSGGQRKKGLQGKGPTPKAKDRVSHPAARRARAAEKASARQTPRGGKRSDGREVLVGRNPVVRPSGHRSPRRRSTCSSTSTPTSEFGRL